MVKEYTLDNILKILNIKKSTFQHRKKNKLKENLELKGYKLLEIKRDKENNNRKIYVLDKFKEVKEDNTIYNKYGYIDLNECIKNGKKFDWKNSIGSNVNGCYKGISFNFKIIDFINNNNTNKIKILYNDEIKECFISSFKSMKGFDILLGIKSYDFKYEIGQRIINYNEDGTVKDDFTIIDRKKGKDSTGHSWKYYKVKCNKCGFDGGEHYLSGEYKEEYWITESQIKRKYGLGCCSGQFCVKGINDMWTTNPDIAELLSNKEDGYKYMIGTDIKLYFKCPYCGRDNLMKPYDVRKYNNINCVCNDKVSYPEKFMVKLLEQLINNNQIEDFIWQYSKANALWCKRYKYDFYFKKDKQEYIIETHGEQHYIGGFCNKKYENSKEIKENDLNKQILALQNGIKPENYIVIDCSKSELYFVKNNILHSKLSEIFDLSNIDWIKCDMWSKSNIYKEICDMWNKLPSNKSTMMIYNKTKYGHTLILSALKLGNDLGWCEYNPKVNYMNDIYIKVTDLNDNLLGVYRGYADLQNKSKEQFGYYLDHVFLQCFLNKTKSDIYENIKILFCTEDYYKQNLNTKINYKLKKKYVQMIYNDNTYYFKNATKCSEYINKIFGRNTSSSSISDGCRKGKLYDYILSFVYLTEDEFNNKIN